MGKLTFIYGTIGSAKTANALMQYFELKNHYSNAILMKPSIDNRDGDNIIKSRIGLEETAVVFSPSDDLNGIMKFKGIGNIIIDEAQFCTEEQINTLKNITCNTKINIYCYGLKTDFTTHLFEGSKRLIEVADVLKELDMTCNNCENKAEVNARLDKNKNIVKDGNQIIIGGNDLYIPLCYKCWLNNITKR